MISIIRKITPFCCRRLDKVILSASSKATFGRCNSNILFITMQYNKRSTFASKSSSSPIESINSASIHKKAAQALNPSLNIGKSSDSSKKDEGNINNNKNKQSKISNNNDEIITSKKEILKKQEIPNEDLSCRTEEEATNPSHPMEKNVSNVQQQQQLLSASSYHMNHFAPRISVVGIGGAGGNAINNMISRKLTGVDFLTINTDAQHLSTSLTENQLQIGANVTSGLGCGANPDAGRLAAEESRDEILEHIQDANMVFLTAGMGGGTGTGACPIIAELCEQHQILTVAVVTKPFSFEGKNRTRIANEGLERLKMVVDTLIVVPNQNLFNLVDRNTPMIEAFRIADDVLLAGVKSITDLMTSPGSINLDFADVQSVMQGMGNAILGSGQCSSVDSENRAIEAANQAISNPLLDDIDISTAKGMLVNISGGSDMTLYEVDAAANKITECLKEPDANIIFGSAFDSSLEGSVRVSVVATGLEDRQ